VIVPAFVALGRLVARAVVDGVAEALADGDRVTVGEALCDAATGPSVRRLKLAMSMSTSTAATAAAVMTYRLALINADSSSEISGHTSGMQSADSIAYSRALARQAGGQSIG